MIQDILAFAQEHLAKGKKAALITITETYGSSPASAGQIMVVLSDGSSAGTVGGGATEYQIKEKAMDAIKNGEKVFNISIDHAEYGMVCGGGMKGFGTILGEENHLYIFGGGHIAQSLAQIAAASGFFITVIEDRPEFESEFSNVRYMLCKPENYEKEISLHGSAYAVICTRGHNTDNEALRYCLSKKLKYLGMIGSSKKAGVLLDNLRRDGYPEETLKNVYTPIGLDIAASVPSEIAVSIMAEILLIKNNGSPNHKRDITPSQARFSQ
jgi:xanthine dehydrogenase accessory factor